MVDVLQHEVDFVLVALGGYRNFSASVGQHPADGDPYSSKNGSTGSFSISAAGIGGFCIIQLGEADLGMGVDYGLLIDPADVFQCAQVGGVLRHAAISLQSQRDVAVVFQRALKSCRPDRPELGVVCNLDWPEEAP